MSSRQIRVADVEATALRISFVGELGWELHVDDENLTQLYNSILDAGDDLGLADFGSYALNSMRIEKGYHGWGFDFGVEFTPADSDLMRFVNLDKEDFIGRHQVVANGHGRKWIWSMFRLYADSDPAPSAPIRQHGDVIGFVTSASPGFRTDTRLALGYVEVGSDLCGGFTVDVLGESAGAERLDRPIYDPDHARPRG